MFIQMKCVLESLRPTKDESKFYGEFMFLGGSVSIPVDSKDCENLKRQIGIEKEVVFRCRPRTVVLYERSVTLFEPFMFVQFK